MKLVNSRELHKLLDEKEKPGYFYNDEQKRFPCYQVNINKEQKKMVFFVDTKEYFSFSLKKMDDLQVTSLDILSQSLKIFKTGDLKQLEEFLKIKAKR